MKSVLAILAVSQLVLASPAPEPEAKAEAEPGDYHDDHHVYDTKHYDHYGHGHYNYNPHHYTGGHHYNPYHYGGHYGGHGYNPYHYGTGYYPGHYGHHGYNPYTGPTATPETASASAESNDKATFFNWCTGEIQTVPIHRYTDVHSHEYEDNDYDDHLYPDQPTPYSHTARDYWAGYKPGFCGEPVPVTNYDQVQAEGWEVDDNVYYGIPGTPKDEADALNYAIDDAVDGVKHGVPLESQNVAGRFARKGPYGHSGHGHGGYYNYPYYGTYGTGHGYNNYYYPQGHGKKY